jgi:hypothetical protein
MLADLLRQTIAAAPRSALPDISAALWRAWGAGGLTDAEAEVLGAAIEAKKLGAETSRAPRPGDRHQEGVQAGSRPVGAASTAVRDRPARPACPGVGSRPRTPQSVERRRRWIASGWLPPGLASRCTPGEAAALAVVAWEVSRRGSCTLAVAAIAAHAGVSETTVRNATRLAHRLGWLSVKERRLSRWRSDTNVLRVVVREWSAWIAHRGTGARGGWVQKREPHEYKKNLYWDQSVTTFVETSRHRSVTSNRDVDEQGVRSVTGRG